MERENDEKKVEFQFVFTNGELDTKISDADETTALTDYLTDRNIVAVDFVFFCCSETDRGKVENFKAIGNQKNNPKMNLIFFHSPLLSLFAACVCGFY